MILFLKQIEQRLNIKTQTLRDLRGTSKIYRHFITQPLSTFDIRKFVTLSVSEKSFDFSRYNHDEKRENDKYLHLSSTVEDEAFQ